MNRRDALKYTALITGGAIATPVATSLLSGCKLEPKVTPYMPKLFSANQYEFIKAVSGTILPEGEMPGALGVGVPQQIDHMVKVTYSAKNRAKYMQGLDALIEKFNQEGENDFVEKTAEIKLSQLTQWEADLKRIRAEERAAGPKEKKKVTEVEEITLEDPAELPPLTPEEKETYSRDTYNQLRQQSIAYFLASEEISKNYLNYLPIPGKYEPCISLSEVDGKAWAI